MKKNKPSIPKHLKIVDQWGNKYFIDVSSIYKILEDAIIKNAKDRHVDSGPL